MTLEQTDMVDFVGVEKATGDLVLTLTDAWGWTPAEEPEHLLLLQDKLNAYIASIETGEILDAYTQRTGKSVDGRHRTRISVRALHPPSIKGTELLRHVQHILRDLGVDFEHIVGAPGSESIQNGV